MRKRKSTPVLSFDSGIPEMKTFTCNIPVPDGFAAGDKIAIKIRALGMTETAWFSLEYLNDPVKKFVAPCQEKP